MVGRPASAIMLGRIQGLLFPLSGRIFRNFIIMDLWRVCGSSKVSSSNVGRRVDLRKRRLLSVWWILYKIKKSRDLPSCSYIPGLVSVNLHEVLPSFIAQRLKRGFVQLGKR